MRVTVCEMHADPDRLERDWEQLVAHTRAHESELVLLPEMPFVPWFGVAPEFDARVWEDALAAHDRWIGRLVELAPASVLGTRPVNRDGRRLNEAFCWSREAGYRAVHHKVHLPNEDGFWEARWYERGAATFAPVTCRGALLGFAICTELWALDQARDYGKAGVHVIATPRATPRETLEKWLVGGRAAAVVSGAYSLSSNHVGAAADSLYLGGQGWVIAPDGEVLALTLPDEPCATVQLDLAIAERAKSTYPRYVFA